MIAVTGGTGLVGSHLIIELLKRGESIRALKRKSSSIKLLLDLAEGNTNLLNNINWIDGDLLDIESLELLIQGCSYVFHCAAHISFLESEATLMDKINIQGTENMVNCCLLSPDLKFFCYVSSVATLGREPGSKMLDENSHWIPGGHNSNYSISKYGAEREVWRGIAEGLPASMVNPSIIVGKTNWKTGSGRLFEQVYKEMPFYTNGSSGFVDVLDVVDAMMLLMDKNIIGERYIINGGNIEYKYFFDRVAASLNKKSPQLKVPKWVSSIVWRLEMIRSLITNKAPFITKESAYAAHQMRSYSSEKLLNIGFAFRNIEETLSRTSKSFLIDIENAKSA